VKKTFTLLLAVVVFTVVGCGNQEESSQRSGESETVSAPKVDLHMAVVMDDTAAIRQHIKAGSDLDVREPSRGSTPLITAAALGKTEAARMLIDAGADLSLKNEDGSTALHTAAFLCREEIVEELLAGGADKSIENSSGMTALEIVEPDFDAVRGFYDEIGKALRPAGVELDYERIREARPRIAEMLR
jgi:ankyrin repeat protein